MRGHGGTPPSPRGYGLPEWRGFSAGAKNVRAGGIATLGEDPSTPPPVHVDFVSGVAPSGTTAAFSPPASTLLVCMINSQGGGQAGSPLSVSDSGSHTWTQRVIKSASGIVSAVFTAPLTSAPGSITVTGSDSVTGAVLQFAVRVLTGVNSNQGSAAVASATGTSANASGSITTTQINSWVFCCSGMANAPTALAGTTTIDTFTSASIGGPNVTGRQSSPTGTPGPTTLGWTQTSGLFAWIALEILHA